MVERQLVGRGIADQRVLDAMARVPRHEFVPEASVPYAYDDRPLPLEDRQTISQPFIVAQMLEAARIGPYGELRETNVGAVAFVPLITGTVSDAPGGAEG